MMYVHNNQMNNKHQQVIEMQYNDDQLK